MKTVYTYIKMVPIGGVRAYGVNNKKKGNAIAVIVWDKQWKLWVLKPAPNTIWSSGCLQDVQDFIEQLEAL